MVVNTHWSTGIWKKLRRLGQIDQLGHFSHVIHALADVDKEAKVFFAKFDIKDWFWRLDAAKGGGLLLCPSSTCG